MTDSTPSARLRFTARRLFAAIAVIYAVVLWSYLVVRVLAVLGLPVSDADPGLPGTWNAIASSLMPALLAPALPLALLAGLLRLPKTALALAPLGVAFVVLYGATLWPPTPQPPAGSSLVVYTHNLHVLTDNLDAAEAEIRASGADVVALQELSEPAANALAVALRDVYPYAALNPMGVTTRGAGILSKWPLNGVETWVTSMVQMRATIAWPGGDVAFYNLHPPPPRWFLRPFDAGDRTFALDEALRRARAESLPVIMAGDFNLTDQTTDYGAIIGAGFQDSFREAGWGLGLTFADFRYLAAPLALAPPFIRIDYVFADESFTPLSASVGAAAGSDHYAVRAELGLNAP